jgi:hypothetical protein
LSAETANPAFVLNRPDTGPLPRDGSTLALLLATELPGDTVGPMSENEAAAHELVRALAGSDELIALLPKPVVAAWGLKKRAVAGGASA